MGRKGDQLLPRIVIIINQMIILLADSTKATA
jgi:hypothetical protein